jgi:transposase
MLPFDYPQQQRRSNMTKPKSKNIPQFDKTQPIFLGIDVHKKNWNISLVHCDQLFFRSSIPGNFEHLWKILKRYSECKIYSVYEAGFSGFHLHFQLTEAGIENIVTPPNKIPIVVGDKVKTDKRDSFKLANFLAKNLLKAIHIPSQELIQVRQLLRTRQQFSRKKVSAMNQIKSLLIQFGTQLPTFSDRLLKSLKKMDLAPNMQLSINYQVELIELLNKQMNFLKKEALTFANRKKYKEDYKRLLSVPGIGPITGIALLFEIGDWARFPNEKS